MYMLENSDKREKQLQEDQHKRERRNKVYIKDFQTYLLTSPEEQHQVPGVTAQHFPAAADFCLASSAQVSLGLAAPDPTDHNGLAAS